MGRKRNAIDINGEGPTLPEVEREFEAAVDVGQSLRVKRGVNPAVPGLSARDRGRKQGTR